MVTITITISFLDRVIHILGSVTSEWYTRCLATNAEWALSKFIAGCRLGGSVVTRLTSHRCRALALERTWLSCSCVSHAAGVWRLMMTSLAWSRGHNGPPTGLAMPLTLGADGSTFRRQQFKLGPGRTQTCGGMAEAWRSWCRLGSPVGRWGSCTGRQATHQMSRSGGRGSGCHESHPAMWGEREGCRNSLAGNGYAHLNAQSTSEAELVV